MGLRLFADERYASNTVTAILTPEGVEANELRRLVQQDYNVVLAEGQGKLAGNVFRIGHLGYCSEKDIDETLAAIRGTFAKLGHPVPIG
jgi:aspartate aminotransferase-like enzyme